MYVFMYACRIAFQKELALSAEQQEQVKQILDSTDVEYVSHCIYILYILHLIATSLYVIICILSLLPWYIYSIGVNYQQKLFDSLAATRNVCKEYELFFNLCKQIATTCFSNEQNFKVRYIQYGRYRYTAGLLCLTIWILCCRLYVMEFNVRTLLQICGVCTFLTMPD